MIHEHQSYNSLTSPAGFLAANQDRLLWPGFQIICHPSIHPSRGATENGGDGNKRFHFTPEFLRVFCFLVQIHHHCAVFVALIRPLSVSCGQIRCYSSVNDSEQDYSSSGRRSRWYFRCDPDGLNKELTRLKQDSALRSALLESEVELVHLLFLTSRLPIFSLQLLTWKRSRLECYLSKHRRSRDRFNREMAVVIPKSGKRLTSLTF